MTPLFKPFMPSELPCAEAILHSGALAYGKYGRTFERELAEYIGIGRFLTTNSYNTAFLVLLATLGIKRGDEVIASPMTCLASSQPFAAEGIRVRWADIDPHTGTLDPESVSRAVTPATKAIFHNHFCGYVGYVEEINTIAKRNGILLVDDAIEAFGSEWNGLRAGNWHSDATIYSFQTVRLPNAIDGGGLSFKSEEHYERAKLLRDYGIRREIFRDELGEISPDCDISLPAYGATLSDFNSYVGLAQMGSLDTLLSKQRNNATAYALATCEAQAVKPLPNTSPNYWVYGTLAKDKRAFIKACRDRGLYASGVHMPNYYYSLFHTSERLPGVEQFHSQFVALPCGWWK